MTKERTCLRIAFSAFASTLPRMSDLVSRFLQAFIPLFVAIDPIGLAAIFLGLGQNVDRAQRQKIADQATWT